MAAAAEAAAAVEGARGWQPFKACNDGAGHCSTNDVAAAGEAAAKKRGRTMSRNNNQSSGTDANCIGGSGHCQ